MKRSWNLFAGKPTYFGYRICNISPPREPRVFLLLHFTAAEIIPPGSVKECIIEKTFNDKQLGGHRFHQISMAAIVSTRQATKDSFICCKPRMGPELRYSPNVTDVFHCFSLALHLREAIGPGHLFHLPPVSQGPSPASLLTASDWTFRGKSSMAMWMTEQILIGCC